MASQGAWQKAGSLMEMTYGPLMTQPRKKALYDRLNGLKDEVLIAAIGQHVDEPEAGKYPPKPADIWGQVRKIEERQQQQRKKSLEDAQNAAYAADESGAGKPVADAPEALQRYVRGLSITTTPARCSTCIDSGSVPYYTPKGSRGTGRQYEVCLKPDYKELSAEEKCDYQRHIAVCGCPSGDYYREKYIGVYDGVQDGRNLLRGLVDLAIVEKMAKKWK